jgi:hypothetical protein
MRRWTWQSFSSWTPGAAIVWRKLHAHASFTSVRSGIGAEGDGSKVKIKIKDQDQDQDQKIACKHAPTRSDVKGKNRIKGKRRE